MSIRAVGLSSMRSEQRTFKGRAQSTSGVGPTGNGQAAFLSAMALLAERRMDGRVTAGEKARSSAPCSHRVPLPCQASLSLREAGQCDRKKVHGQDGETEPQKEKVKWLREHALSFLGAFLHLHHNPSPHTCPFLHRPGSGNSPLSPATLSLHNLPALQVLSSFSSPVRPSGIHPILRKCPPGG